MTATDSVMDQWSGAAELASSALTGPKSPYAVYTGGPSGVVMLHLLKVSGGGKVPVPVVFVQWAGQGAGRLRFQDKLRRIWRFCAVIEKLPPRTGGGEYTADELTNAAYDAVSRSGGDGVVLPWTGTGCTAPPPSGMDVITPLAGFTDEDVERYIALHRLPHPSETGGETAAGASEDMDMDEVGEKLRQLGYM